MGDSQLSKGQLALLNIMTMGRANRRKLYRKYLKANKVPKIIFHKVSDALNFKRLNMLTFLEDIKKQAEADMPPAQPKKNGPAL